jgi:hypothetical protein
MALTAGTPWLLKWRAWGFEARVDYIDPATGKIYNEEIVLDSEPDQTALDAAVATRKALVEARLAAEVVPEYSVTCDDGTVVQS